MEHALTIDPYYTRPDLFPYHWPSDDMSMSRDNIIARLEDGDYARFVLRLESIFQHLRVRPLTWFDEYNAWAGFVQSIARDAGTYHEGPTDGTICTPRVIGDLERAGVPLNTLRAGAILAFGDLWWTS